MMPPSPRIAVTGVGIVSALGADARTTFRRLLDGERGFSRVTLFDTSGQRSELGAEVRDLSVADVAPAGEAEAWSRSDAMAVVAAREALSSARIRPHTSGLALAVGATTAGMYEAETALAKMAVGTLPADAGRRLSSFPLSASTERVASAVGPVERSVTICSACSSGANALIQGAAWLRRGVATCVLAGATDGLCRLTFSGFNSLGATDPGPCRPFDAGRAGLTLGEGAGFVVLEREEEAVRRGATVLAWLSEFAIAAEAHHITNPEPSGATATRLLRETVTRAGLAMGDVDYVNAHGTATVHNDAMEARALAAALGEATAQTSVSSCKGQLGHTLAAAGAIEAAVTVLAVEAGVIPPTGGLTTPDEVARLRHVMGRGEPRRVRAALSSSFGFGGTDTVLLFEHADAPSRSRSASTVRRVVVTGSASQEAADWALAELDSRRSRRFDGASALVSAGAERALGDANLGARGVGLVSGTAFGSVERSARFVERLLTRGPRLVNPAEFPHLLPSAPSGNASVYVGLTGPVLSVAELGTDAEAALGLARDLIALGLADGMVAGGAAARDPISAELLGPLVAGDDVDRSGEGAGWLVLESEHAARERQARVLAELVDTIQVSDDDPEWQISLRAPRSEKRARLLHTSDEVVIVERLGGSAWAQVPRQNVSQACGRHDAAGALVLAAAATLVFDSAADDVLVCGVGRRCFYATHLARPGLHGPPGPG